VRNTHSLVFPETLGKIPSCPPSLNYHGKRKVLQMAPLPDLKFSDDEPSRLRG
jgi:hypothetical protein